MPENHQVRYRMRKTQLRVNLWLADGQIRAVGCVADVTLGAASIVMANPLPAGLDVELEFLALEQPRPRVHGTVVSSEGEEMRVQFHDLAASELQALERLLGSHVSRAVLRKAVSFPSTDRPGMQIIRKNKKT